MGVAGERRRAEAASACRHCGLPIPASRRERADVFCCDGCSRVNELLRSEGLDRFYDLRGDEGTPPAALRAGGMTWLAPLLEAQQPVSGRPVRLSLDLQGVHCAACVWLLRELFFRRAGAIELRINAARGGAELVFDPARFDVRSYLVQVERFGYRFGPPRQKTPSRSRTLLIRLGICAAAAGNVMLMSISLYAGLGPGDAALYPLFGWLSLALSAVAVAVGGWVFFKAAAAGILTGAVHLDLPIALGIGVAFAGSVYAHLQHGPEHAYYDTVSIFVTLMLLGRFLQERVLERNRAAVLAAEDVGGLVVRRVREGRVEPVAAAQIAAADEILVVPGDLVPTAAVVLGHSGEVALDWISGEPDLRPVAPGDDVPAGAFNGGRTVLRLAAAEPFAASRLHELLTPARDGDLPLGPSGVWWRHLGTIYVVAVLLLAALAFVVWIGRGVEPAVRVTVAVLVVTCPCAIGLAIPLAHELTNVALRRGGIFVREGGFFDRALRVRRVFFDKTGTLTAGEVELQPEGRHALERLHGEEREVLEAMASHSNHPASRALASAVRFPAAVAEDEISAMEAVPGQGLRWRRGAVTWRLGRREFAVPGNAAAASLQDGTWFSRDGVPLARFGFAEQARPDVAGEIARLRASGLDVRILSGDAPLRVRALADAVGVGAEHAAGGLSPEEKAARIEELDRRDTLMVGDGVNDAPAFAAAFCTATPAVDRPHLPARADFYYLGDGIAAVATALTAAAALRRVIWANLVFAVAYNAVALTLAFAGLATPLLAAVLMPASSLTVVGHTLLRLGVRRQPWR